MGETERTTRAVITKFHLPVECVSTSFLAKSKSNEMPSSLNCSENFVFLMLLMPKFFCMKSMKYLKTSSLVVTLFR